MIVCAHNKERPDGAKATESALKYGCESCEYIYNNELYKCSKFVYLAGKFNGQQIDQPTGKCADEWQPILLVQAAMTNIGQTEALCDFKNTVLGYGNKNNKQLRDKGA